MEEKSASHLKAPSGLFMTEADLGVMTRVRMMVWEMILREINSQMEDEGMGDLIMPENLLQDSIVINDDGAENQQRYELPSATFVML